MTNELEATARAEQITFWTDVVAHLGAFAMAAGAIVCVVFGV